MISMKPFLSREKTSPGWEFAPERCFVRHSHADFRGYGSSLKNCSIRSPCHHIKSSTVQRAVQTSYIYTLDSTHNTQYGAARADGCTVYACRAKWHQHTVRYIHAIQLQRQCTSQNIPSRMRTVLAVHNRRYSGRCFVCRMHNGIDGTDGGPHLAAEPAKRFQSDERFRELLSSIKVVERGGKAHCPFFPGDLFG